jgi:hypothetical protein
LIIVIMFGEEYKLWRSSCSLDSPWEDNSQSTTQDIPRLLQKLKVRPCVYKSPPPVLILW